MTACGASVYRSNIRRRRDRTTPVGGAQPRPTRIPSSPPFTSVPDLRDRAQVPHERPARSAPQVHRALENSCVRCPLWQRRECASPMTFHLPAWRSSFMP